MKFKKPVLLIALVFTLSSCSSIFDKWFHKDPETENTTNQDSGNNNGHTDVTDDDDEEEENNESRFTSKTILEDGHTGYEFVSNNIQKQTTGTAEITIGAFNDFHGAIKEDGDTHSGLAHLASFVKTETAKDNTLVLDQGDTWQGSYESNSNYGKFIQEIFADANLSCRTVGNHDFDWGQDNLKAAVETGNAKYTVPCLAANVYDYDWSTKTEGNIQQTQFGREYATYTLENGVKVGVIGVIGKNQITSICTQLVKNICFKDHVQTIKNLSDYLRTERDCDVIIASTHEQYSQVEDMGLASVSSVSGKRYCDLVLNGHSHSEDKNIENGVLFTQYDSDSQTCGLIKLNYDIDQGVVLTSNYKDRDIYYPKYLRAYYPLDNSINTKVNSYLQSISEKGNEVLSDKFTGYFSQSENLPNLMAEAIYDAAKKVDSTIQMAVVNMARADFPTGTVTFSDLYRSFPFDNEIIIMDVSGRNSINSIGRNFSCHEDIQLRSTEIYRVAIIDYVGLHCNSDRDYDYFSVVGEQTVLQKDGKPYYYRDVLYDYLTANKTKTFNASDYMSYSNSKFGF